MNFNNNGTISVDIDGNTYSLGRPTISQLYDFMDLRTELTDRATAQLSEWAAELAEIEDETTPEAQDLITRLKDRRFIFRFLVEPWLRAAFEQLGSKPLPENLDTAPSELTDPALAAHIIKFWQTTPLARLDRQSR